MMTNDQHRAVGLLLGYPTCCVEEFASRPANAAAFRGVILGPHRTAREVLFLKRKIRELLGRDFPVRSRVSYVPCLVCAEKHWRKLLEEEG